MNWFHLNCKRALTVRRRWCPLLLFLLCLPLLARAQSAGSPPVSAPPEQTASELSSRDEVTTFKVRVNLVLVRAVVRDSQDHAVGGLTREDFEVFDNNKPQTIVKFSVEQPGAQVAQEEKSSLAAAGETPGKVPGVPERYVAYLFDDVHLNSGDLMQVRMAADRHLASLEPTDRAAIFSTSGRTTLDFTDDRSRLHATLMQLQPRPVTGSGVKDCPDVSYYLADLIQNKHDPQAIQVATLDALACAFQNDQRMIAAAQAMAQGEAGMQIGLGDHETQIALSTLKDVVRRVSITPGQRTVILVSPGFLNPDQRQEETDIIERGLHANVIISALDARGLYVDPSFGDISQPGGNPLTSGLQAQYRTASASAESDIMAEFAYATGGTFFQNRNDLQEGFRRLAAAPEYYYLLGFSPQNLKPDGRYHSLKVRLKTPQKLSVQARRGYYAPTHIADAAEQAKQEIEEALFSQEEMHDLPVELHTQFFKASDTAAKLAVLARLDVKHMHFRKIEGRNGNELTIVSGIFDRNGQFITGNEKILTMRLRDETLEHKLQSGVTMKSSFDVKPGSYLVRLVVRDTEGQISAENGAIEIP
jgi:VWFA-related protein